MKKDKSEGLNVLWAIAFIGIAIVGVLLYVWLEGEYDSTLSMKGTFIYTVYVHLLGTKVLLTLFCVLLLWIVSLFEMKKEWTRMSQIIIVGVLPIATRYVLKTDHILGIENRKHTLTVRKHTKFIEAVDDIKLNQLTREMIEKMKEEAITSQFIITADENNLITVRKNELATLNEEDVCVTYFNSNGECRVQIGYSNTREFGLEPYFALKSPDTCQVYLTANGYQRVSNILEYRVVDGVVKDVKSIDNTEYYIGKTVEIAE